MTTDRYGAQCMTAPLHDVLMRRPGLNSPRPSTIRRTASCQPVDLELARRQHDGLCDLLTRLGVTVHVLDEEGLGPDAV